MGNLGIIPVFSNEELQAQEEQALLDQENAASLFADNLTAHIRKAWLIAREAKRPIETSMIRSLRARNGIYEPEKLAAIKEMGGSEIYVLITLTKCRAAEAWINDVLRPAGDKPWALDPTPIPELPADIEQEVQNQVALEVQAMQQELQQLNILQIPEVVSAFKDYMEGVREHLNTMLDHEAKEASVHMEELILDQQVEGNFLSAFKQVINDMITLKAGILKGPVIRRKKTKKWIKEGGQWTQDLVDTLVPEFDRVSPFDFYPAPGASSIDDGDIIERHFLKRSDLAALIGVPGYKEDTIRKVLDEHDRGYLREVLPMDTERYFIEHGETATMRRTGKIEALEYWGSVQGKYLTEWGLEGDIDPEMEYEINAWVIGNDTIKAVVNPDKLGRKPYSMSSFEKIPGSVWGKGIPEMMADIQDVCNAVARAMVNNAQLASGPMVEVNVDKCDANTAMYPWKVFQSNNQTMSEAPAVHYYQPQMYVGPLLQVYEFFSLASDETTGVPRWAYGNTNVGGAGSTSSGLSMLMTYAARGIKQVLASLDDDIIGPTLQRHYDYNMAYYPDMSVKGDVKIIAKGSSSLIAREQQAMRIREMLQVTANPVDMQLLGLESRLEMLKHLFKSMDLDIESIPENDKLKQIVSEIKQQIAAQQQANVPQSVGLSQENQQAQQQGTAPPAKGPQMDNAGNVAGGRDTNLNLEGRAEGGPVQAGTPYLMGELGRELLLNKDGSYNIVGSDGPEIRIPTQDGVVIPNGRGLNLGYTNTDTGGNVKLGITPSEDINKFKDFVRGVNIGGAVPLDNYTVSGSLIKQGTQTGFNAGVNAINENTGINYNNMGDKYYREQNLNVSGKLDDYVIQGGVSKSKTPEGSYWKSYNAGLESNVSGGTLYANYTQDLQNKNKNVTFGYKKSF